MQLPAHGANSANLYKLLQLAMPDKIIDLSENVNHQGTPSQLKVMWPNVFEVVSHYPDEQAEPLKTQLADRHHLPKEHVLVTNGAAEGLMALAQYFKGRRVGLIEPCFSEYRRTLQQQGCDIVSIVVEDVVHYTITDELLAHHAEQLDVIYLCNPNNPTGVLTTKEQITGWLTLFPHITWVIDEAFMDWTDEQHSVVSLVEAHEQLFVLRSMTKMYALAGIRLGYVLGQHVQSLQPYLPHWNVSGVAIHVGCACLGLQDFVTASRQQADQQREQMTIQLQQLGFVVTNSSTNFLTCQPPVRIAPDDFYLTMLQKGIVLRHTKNFNGLDGKWFRIAVKSAKMWEKGYREIKQYVENH